MNKDLTVGKPETVLWKFCLPLFGSIIFQQLYNIADSFVAGKFVGEDALAAVGNSYEITLIFIAFAFGCNMGCSVLVAQLFGAGKYRDLKTAAYTTLIASGVLCALLMVLGLGFCGSLLSLINTPDNVMADSMLYLRIYCLGLPFVFYYNVATGIFSALGDSKTPFVFLAASSTSNIAMEVGVEILHILSPFYFVVASKLVADGILRGSGMMGKFMIATFTDLILRVVLAYVLSSTTLGTTGIWLAWPVGWTVATGLSISFYRTGVWFSSENAQPEV